MTKDEALKLALEALTIIRGQLKSWGLGDEAIAICKQALAAPVQEPVAWRWVNPKGWLTYGEKPHDTFKSTPLYTTPHAQPAVPDAMTSADIQENIEYVAGWNDCRQAMMEMMK